MLNFNTIMVGTSQPKVLVEFYQKVFDKKPDMEDSGWAGWKVGSCYFNIGEHSEVTGTAKEPQRILLNFETSDVQGEFDRIKEIEGITIIKEPYTMEGWEGSLIATLADPDGNYFQLVPPWESAGK